MHQPQVLLQMILPRGSLSLSIPPTPHKATLMNPNIGMDVLMAKKWIMRT